MLHPGVGRCRWQPVAVMGRAAAHWTMLLAGWILLLVMFCGAHDTECMQVPLGSQLTQAQHSLQGPFMIASKHTSSSHGPVLTS